MRPRAAVDGKGCVATDWRHGWERLFVCKKNESVERCWVLWIARHIFNLFPRAGVWLRIRAGDRENERRSGENLIRFCALIGERALRIIECQNWLALATSDLTGEHDVERRRRGVFHQRFHLPCGRLGVPG